MYVRGNHLLSSDILTIFKMNNTSEVSDWLMAGNIRVDHTLQAGVTIDSDNISIRGTSCIWDLDASTVTPDPYTIVSGYTGTFAQGSVDIGIGGDGFYQSGESVTWNATKTVICAGNHI